MPHPFPTASPMGNLIINPDGVTAGLMEVVMIRPAWRILDLSPLWGFPDQRGENEITPGAIGRRANPKRTDQTTHLLLFHILGEYDPDDALYPEPLMGLHTNLRFLEENVHNPPPLPATARDAILVLPDASEWTAEIQISLALGEQLTYEVRAAVSVTILGGGFSEGPAS